MFYRNICAHGRLNGQTTCIGNDAKPKMKHPSDIPTQDSNSGCSDLWSNALPVKLRRRPYTMK